MSNLLKLRELPGYLYCEDTAASRRVRDAGNFFLLITLSNRFFINVCALLELLKKLRFSGLSGRLHMELVQSVQLKGQAASTLCVVQNGCFSPFV